MFQLSQLFLLFLLILIVVLVLTVLTYTKKTIKNVTAGTSNVTVEESNGNAIISVTGGSSGDFLPLSGGTMSGSIDMGSQNITDISLVSTTSFTLNTKPIVYGLPAGSGEGSLNLYVNGTSVAPYLYPIASNAVAIALTSSYNGEIWVFPSTFGTVFNIVTSYATLPAGFYLNLVNRKTAVPITINIYNVATIPDINPTDPFVPPAAPISTQLGISLPVSSSRYLYFNGTTFSSPLV